VKRSLLTEGHGLPIGLTIKGANRHDMKLVRPTIESIIVDRPEPSEEQPQGMCLDKGYDYDEVRDILHGFGFTAHIRPRGEEAKAIQREAGFKARRWVVERAHSWMNRFRRLLIRWDKKPENYLSFLHFACGLIAFRSARIFGEAPHLVSREWSAHRGWPGASLRAVEIELTDLTPFCYHWRTEKSRSMVLLKQEHIA
jgi:putative transposase